MTMTDDDLKVIRKRCDDAQDGYSGMRERDYARDVRKLLAMIDKQDQDLKVMAEAVGLWSRDCEIAQARVAELERDAAGLSDVSYDSKDGAIGSCGWGPEDIRRKLLASQDPKAGD